MIRELVKSDDSILHRKIKPCGVNLDRHFLAKTLIENMHHYDGVGLSANQIGIDARAFAMMRGTTEMRSLPFCVIVELIMQKQFI